MSQLCAEDDQMSSDTEKIPFEGIREFTRDLRMQEKMHSIDVRIHHRIWDVQKHLSPVRVDLMQQPVNR